MPPTRASRQIDWPGYLGALFLVALTLLAMGRVVSNQFTWWDDQKTIHHHPDLSPPTGASIAKAWSKTEYGLYAPLTSSYWIALARFAEMPAPDADGIHLSARVFHAGSLALHIGTVLVVFSILRLLASRAWPAVAGAALFAVHPIQVESVAWASGAKDLLAGLLGACALYQYLLFARISCNEKPEARKQWVYYFSGMALLILAMLAKPSAMVIPALALVLDRAMVGRTWKQSLSSTAGWALAALPLIIVARIVQTADGVAITTFWQRPFIAGEALAFYLWKLLWPTALTPDYGHRPAVVMQIAGGVWLYTAWLIPALVAAILWKLKTRDNENSHAWGRAAAGVFLFAVFPMLGFAPFMFQYMSTVADHYLYLAMLGPALAVTGVGVCFAQIRERANRANAQTHATNCTTPSQDRRWAQVSRGAQGAFILILGMLAVRSANQMTHWQNEQTLWTHTLAVSPESFVAPNNLAASAGRTAIRLAREATDARERGDLSRARALLAQRETTLRQAGQWLDRSLQINPDYLAARMNAVANAMRLGDWASAAEHVEGLLAANQRVPAYQRDNLTTFHDTAGHLWMKLKRYDRAAAHFEEFVRQAPNHAEARQNLQEARSRMAEASTGENDE